MSFFSNKVQRSPVGGGPMAATSPGVLVAPTVMDPDIQAAGDAARLAASVAAGRMSTILTSGLGVSDAPYTRKKTLLGA